MLTHHRSCSKKSKLQAAGLAPAILEGLMPITTEPEPEDADDDAPSRSALRIIDALATSLPPAQVFPALRQLVQQYVSQPDPNARRGALLALGVAVEGVSEFMSRVPSGQSWMQVLRILIQVFAAGLAPLLAVSVRTRQALATRC